MSGAEWNSAQSFAISVLPTPGGPSRSSGLRSASESRSVVETSGEQTNPWLSNQAAISSGVAGAFSVPFISSSTSAPLPHPVQGDRVAGIDGERQTKRLLRAGEVLLHLPQVESPVGMDARVARRLRGPGVEQHAARLLAALEEDRAREADVRVRQVGVGRE